MSTLRRVIGAVADSACSLSFYRDDRTSKNVHLTSNPNLLRYLRKISRSSRGTWLVDYLDHNLRPSGLSMDEIQFLCNRFADDHQFLSELSLHLPPNSTFKLSDDFKFTHLILFMEDEKVIHRRAVFGLIDSCENGTQHRDVDGQIFSLLRNALRNSDLEETVVTLQGGDAQRALELMQQLVEVEASWTRFTQYWPNSDDHKFGGVTWRRVRRLLATLAAFREEVPPSLVIEGLRRREIPLCGTQFTDLYEAQYGDMKVAVKRIRTFSSLFEPRMELPKILLYEALTWKELYHPRILPFLGINQSEFLHTQAPYSVVVPWVERGNVRKCIQELQKSAAPIPTDRWIFEIAEGLSYLHNSNVVHGALRGSNVLIDEEYHVKLADFGLSGLIRAYGTHAVASFLGNPSPRWMAPENYAFDLEEDLELPEGPTFAGDIYSFACVCVEIYSNDAPQFAGISSSFRGTDRKIEKAGPLKIHQRGRPGKTWILEVHVRTGAKFDVRTTCSL